VSEAKRQSDAVDVINPAGAGAVVLLCEHASNLIPARYHGLGVKPDDRDSHAAWDPGALALSLLLSQALDAPLVASTVSRLVYDCNRPPEAPSAMPEKSELVEVPGNRNLTEADRDERVQTIYVPFCAALSDLLEARAARGQATVLVTVHSFTPVYFGKPRAVEIGILHDADTRVADAMLAAAPALPHRRIERNMPYGPADRVTHSLQLHALSRGLPNVMLELRNDLVSSSEDIAAIAEEVLILLTPALKALETAEMAGHA
jgi:predicted N-formylglutamate amidohydrolase